MVNTKCPFIIIKKAIVALLTVLLAVMLIMGIQLTVRAAETTSSDTSGSDGKTYVIDNAGILTDNEEQKLEALCKKASDDCEIDFVVMTTNTGLDYSNLDNYVREILESQYGYHGTGDDCDAACYVIDMTSRADRIITSGRARTETTFTDDKLSSVRSAAETQLSNQNYYKGCVKYIQGMERYLNHSISYRLTLYLPIKLLISLCVAVVAVVIMMIHAKAKMTVSGNTYAKGHHGNLVGQHDRFINTTVVRHRIQTNHGGGGGGDHGGGGNSGSSGGHF